jgi:hypothetical protein
MPLESREEKDLKFLKRIARDTMLIKASHLLMHL